jgi:hypothetical protein
MSIAAPRPVRSRLRAVWLAVLIVTVACVLIPLDPVQPSAGLDPSWVLAMNEAVARGLAFGRELVLTFGPYASVFTRAYHPATDTAMLVASAGLALGLCVGIARLTEGRGAGWPLTFALTLVLAVPSRDVLMFAIPLIAALVVLDPRDDGTRDTGPSALLLALLFAPLGLLPFSKGSLIVPCAVAAGLAMLRLVLDGRQGRAAVVLASIAVTAIGGWLAAGQPLANLGPYLAGLAPVMSGYTEAMALDGPGDEIAAFLAAAALVLTGLLLPRAPGRIGSRLLATLALSAFLFVAFKSAFVRHDAHALIGSQALLVAALLSGLLIGARRALPGFVAVLAAFTFIEARYVEDVAQAAVRHAAAVYRTSWEGLQARSLGTQGPAQAFEAAMARLRSEARLPVMRGTADIYSFDQAHLIASGNAWRPRPVLQSYVAYTPSLLARNRAHLLGERAPDNIVFRIEPIDDRLPALEDGASWPVLLRDYEPVALAPDTVLLRRRTDRSAPADPAPPAWTAFGLGERIAVPPSDGPVFVRLDIRPTFVGRLFGLLFKPSRLELELALENGTTVRHRIVSGMAAGGVVLSPHVAATADFAALWGDADHLPGRRVVAMTVRTAGWTERGWQQRLGVAFEPLAPTPSPTARALLAPDREVPTAADVAVRPARRCDASLDGLNGLQQPAGEVSTRALVALTGWAAPSGADGIAAQEVLAVLQDAQGGRRFFTTRTLERPDVAAHFGRPALARSGFNAAFDVGTTPGRYRVGVAFREADGSLSVCPVFGPTLLVRGL